MKRLIDILPQEVVSKYKDLESHSIESIKIDSRKVKRNDLFIAIKGFAVDGHDYISQAIEQGATIIIAQKGYRPSNAGVLILIVDNTRSVLADTAANFYGNPSSKMAIVGVTGTNGKTTVVSLLSDVVRRMGYKVGMLSTVENRIDHEVLPSDLTTPDALAVQALLSKMYERGCQYVFMEVSSHAIDQQRIAGIDFDVAVFTNISRDHLDYHRSFREYIDTKKRFFDHLDSEATALVNIDDKHGTYMVQNTKAKIKRFSLRTLTDYKCKVLSSSMEGLHLSINGVELYSLFIGRYNAYNLTTAFAVLDILDFEEEDFTTALSEQRPTRGRFEVVRMREGGPIAIVDYAHTPDALDNVLNTLKQVAGKKKIITVVGCGGDRDKGKRPQMAKIAFDYSDQVVFTSDNPRFEDPYAILEDMEAGLTEDQKKEVVTIENRRQAIKTAVRMAQQNSVILVAGKGHERYQDIKGVKTPFDDKLVLQEYL